MHRRIRWMRRKFQGLSTSGVLITKSHGNKVLVSEQDALETVIIQENERKFHQTEGKCPLTEGQLLRDIGLCATGPLVPDILNGTYQFPQGTKKPTRDFLSACAQPPHFCPAPYDHFSLQHYKQAWSAAKESTGSGKVHFGHWKAGVLDDEICEIQWLMTILPAIHGFSPSTWQTATDVMILKKAGVLDIEKLRTIVLYEADYNFLNKCIGRQVMDNAIHNHSMADEQYAKPGVSAQDQCLTRRLIFDIVRFTRQALAMASSDLKSCYDRIVHSAASLAMQKCGISQNTVSSMFQTIQNCQHTIRTAYGDSHQTYGGQGKYELPVMGAGQGNGAGPQMWAVISAVLFLAMHMEGFSTTFCQKMTSRFLSLTGFMYVDDMDLICISDEADSNEINEELQLMLGYWNKLVRVTGGALEPNKSGWYSFQQQWNPDKMIYEYVDNGNFGDITARDDKRKKIPLQFYSFKESQEMLGVKMCPTGESHDQIQAMMEIANREANLIRRGNINETDIRHAIVSSIFPRLNWPLPCMSISLKESKQLFRPILNAALPKMKIVSTLGYDYIHGSSSFQGLGLPELYHSGYSKQIEMLTDHIWKQTHTGHFIQMAIQEFILESGSMQPIFQPDTNTRLSSWLLTQNTWIGALRNYVLENGISIHITLPPLTGLRQNDSTIMDTLDKQACFSSLELRDINICRLYKKVLFLSDITSGDGRKVTAHARTDQPIQRVSTYPFVRQDYPSPRQWSAWEKAITFIHQLLQTRTRPLGKWIMDDTQYFKNWDYFYDSTHQLLLEQSLDGSWKSYPISKKRTRHCTFLRTSISIPPPTLNSSLLRTTVTISQNTLIEEGGQPTIKDTRTIDDHNILPPSDRIRILSKRYPDSSWALKHMEFSPSIDKLLEDFARSRAVMVGDGSFEDILGLGAGACIISSFDETEYIIVGGPTPGPKISQSAYRSELGTVVAMGILSHILCAITNSQPHITVSCDNDKALERPFLGKKYISSRHPSSDLLSLAHDLWKASPATPIPTKVQGHADVSRQHLSLLERLNCRVDIKAKEYLTNREKTSFSRVHDSSYGMPTISFQHENITGCFSATLQEHQALLRSKTAGIRSHRVTPTTWEQIDHRALSRSSKQMSTYKKTLMLKWTAQQLPVGSCLLRRKHRLEDTCPTCLQTPETMTHLTTCPSRESIQNYHAALETLSSWMQSVDTDPIIHQHLISTLSLLRTSQNRLKLPYPCSLTKTRHYEAFLDQDKIGWKQFTEGLISDKWAVLQHSYYQRIGKRGNGLTWAAKLIVQLWEVNFSIWIFRNTALHSNQTLLQQLHGEKYLNQAIQQEYQQGRNGLTPQIANFFSQHTLNDLMTRDTSYKLHWFHIVRTARESNNTSQKDAFSYNGALRTWARLPNI